MKGFAIALLLAALAGAAKGQQPRLAVLNVVPASYIVGPNDVLSMTVFGAPELADSQMRVDTDGTIHTPYGSTPVHVAGLTPAGIRQAIAAELEKDQLAVDPKVEVQVVDAESHPITITGAGVRSPGTIQAVKPIRLLDALTQVGGLSNNNGDEITVIAPGPNGRISEQKFAASEVQAATGDAFNPWLRGGEEVRVMPGGNAYLSGAVVTPGAYPLNDSDPLTVRKAMAKAHGLASAAKANQAQLIHHVGQPDQTMSIINLPGILAGTTPDITLAANDMVYVPVSTGKKAGLEVLRSTLTALTIAAGEIIVR